MAYRGEHRINRNRSKNKRMSDEKKSKLIKLYKLSKKRFKLREKIEENPNTSSKKRLDKLDKSIKDYVKAYRRETGLKP